MPVMSLFTVATTIVGVRQAGSGHAGATPPAMKSSGKGMLHAYSKNEQEDLTPKQIKDLSKIVKEAFK